MPWRNNLFNEFLTQDTRGKQIIVPQKPNRIAITVLLEMNSGHVEANNVQRDQRDSGSSHWGKIETSCQWLVFNACLAKNLV